MTALSYTAAKISADPDKGSVLRNHLVAEAMSIGNFVALDSDGSIVLTDANALATGRGYGQVVAAPNYYGETTLAVGERASVCVYGPTYGWDSLAEGTYGYVSETAGAVDDTAPTGGAYQFIMGHCVESDVFFVNPGMAAPVSA
jgi:hypothetical protein